MAARDTINKVEPPALPVAPQSSVLRDHLDVLNNVLRLFFNRLANNVNLLTGEYGGRFVEKPNAVFYSTVDQTAASTGTAYALQFENTYLGEAINITGTPKTRITPTFSGIYNFQISAELFSNSASSKVVDLWIRRSGVDIGNTAKEHILSGSGGIDDFNYNFNIDVSAGQYIEMMWATNDTDAIINYQAASSPRPAIPSTVATVTFVSALPETLPTPP